MVNVLIALVDGQIERCFVIDSFSTKLYIELKEIFIDLYGIDNVITYPSQYIIKGEGLNENS